MNKKRREEIKAIALQLETLRDKIEDLKSEEEASYENMPDGLKDTDRGNESQEASYALDGAYGFIDDAISNLGEAAGDE